MKCDDIAGMGIPIVLLVLVCSGLITYLFMNFNSNSNAKIICTQKGYDNGIVGITTNKYPVQCYDYCFNRTNGNYICNVAYYREGE